MVYYTNVLEPIFDAFEKFCQIDGKLNELTLGCIKNAHFFPNTRDES